MFEQTGTFKCFIDDKQNRKVRKNTEAFSAGQTKTKILVNTDWTHPMNVLNKFSKKRTKKMFRKNTTRNNNNKNWM